MFFPSLFVSIYVCMAWSLIRQYALEQSVNLLHVTFGVAERTKDKVMGFYQLVQY